VLIIFNAIEIIDYTSNLYSQALRGV